MGISRYRYVGIANGGRTIMTSEANTKIRTAVLNGVLGYRSVVLQEPSRLDQIAGEQYGDSSYWWVIAAASTIGWGLQVPRGTLLLVPTSINKVFKLLGA